MTLEVVEAIARAFEVMSLIFMASALEDKDAEVPEDSGFLKRFAERELGNLIGSKLDGPGMTWLIDAAVVLTDEHLDMVGQVADAFLQAQVVAQADLEEYSFLFDALFPSGRAEQSKTRSRSASVRRARKPRAEVE